MTRRLVTSFRTFWVLIVITAGLLAYDIYAFYTPEVGDTFSEMLGVLAVHSKALVFAAGFICGHVFWVQEEVKG